MVIATALDWPTLTVEWLPEIHSVQGDKSLSARLMFGSHTSGSDKDYIHVASVELPATLKPPGVKYEEQTPAGDKILPTSAQNPPPKKLTIVQSMLQEGEVNVARYNPSAPRQIAASSVTGEIHVFDRSDVASSRESAKPQYNLVHHTKEGWGLAWNPNVATQLVSGGNDTTVALWNLPEGSTPTKVSPTTVYSKHTAPVNDVQFNHKLPYLFGSASDDATVKLWDSRKADPQPVCSINESRGVNSLDFNPHTEFLLATASADETVKVWDMRKLDTPFATLYSHADEVTSVKWSPHEPTVLASGSHDRSILVWDLARLNDDLSSDENEEGPAELLFHHGGHNSRISDFDWHPTLPWVIASAAEDNVIQVWRMAESISKNEVVVADAEEDVEMES